MAEKGEGDGVAGSAGPGSPGRAVGRSGEASGPAGAGGSTASDGGVGSDAEVTVPLGPAGRAEAAGGTSAAAGAQVAGDESADGVAVSGPGGRSRFSAASAMIGLLLAVLGFTLVVQLRTNSTDASLESARQEDLVRILSDLDAQEERVRQDIAGLEESQRQLSSGVEGQQAALDEATRRADELGVLAGTLRVRGPGLEVTFRALSKPIAASRVLDAVQELRGAGGEAMQITGGDGAAVRIVASTYFLDVDGGISVGGQRLVGPYTILVVGDPTTMRTALNIPGGVVASVGGDGGNVTIVERDVVEVTAVSPQKDLQYARPVS